ncbi:MAG: alpha/beta hydrolase [Microvirga sp.]
MTTETFDFYSPRGYRLSGRLEIPDVPRAWAIFAHCFTCGKGNLAAARIGRSLAAAGIGVLRFDFAGLGASQGVFADGSFTADVKDLFAGAEALTATGRAPTLLLGHSLGGTAVLAALSAIVSARAVATIATPFDPAHILQHFDPDSLAGVDASGEAVMNLAGQHFRVRKSFIEDLRTHNLASDLAKLRRPLLVLHSPDDKVVEIENAYRIFEAAHHPEGFVSLDNMDHLLSKPEDAAHSAVMIAAWASRYLADAGTELSQ